MMRKKVSIAITFVIISVSCWGQNFFPWDINTHYQINYIYDTVRYGHECYGFNNPNGLVLELENNYIGSNLSFRHLAPLVAPDDPYYMDDTICIIQKYAEHRDIYGVAMNFAPGWGNGYNDVELYLKYLHICAVLYVTHEDGTMEKVDETPWDTTVPYKFFRYYPPLCSFDLSVPTCELYFDTLHNIEPTDTAWVGLEIRKDKSLDSCYDEFEIYFWLFYERCPATIWWIWHRASEAYCQTIPHAWGGVFPITCPKPEGPVEDTVDNGIARVRALREEVSVYPNPARDWVEVRSEGVEVLGVTVYDMRGQIALKEHSKSTQSRVNIGALPNGVYMMRVETDRGTAIKKVVKR